jgi:hypothetical protein
MNRQERVLMRSAAIARTQANQGSERDRAARTQMNDDAA